MIVFWNVDELVSFSGYGRNFLDDTEDYRTSEKAYKNKNK